ncbi:uncharacterized protein LOC100187295 [Ciona intestinalis]
MGTQGQGRLRVTSNPANYSLDHLHPTKTKSHNRIPLSMRKNESLKHPDLTKGQKQYLWSICSIYSTAQMKQLLQDQFVNQLYYEMKKGIIRSVDWYKYLDYISDPSKRKQQFNSLSSKSWRAPKDKYMFRYYREHPVDLPTPSLPGFVDNEVKHWNRTPKPPQRPIHYVTRRRRKQLEAGDTVRFPTGKDLHDLPPRPHTVLGYAAPSPKYVTSPTEISSYSNTFTGSGSSSNGGSEIILGSSNRKQGEGLTRPKSRIGSSQRRMINL